MLSYTNASPTCGILDKKRHPVNQDLYNIYLTRTKSFIRHPVSKHLLRKYVSPIPRPGISELLAFRADIEKIISIESRKIPLHRLGFNLEDMYQEGWIHAMQAYETYDPMMGTKLKTWVIKHIRQMLLNFNTKSTKKKRRKITLVDQQQFDWMECPEDIFAWELMEDLRQNLTDFDYSVLRCRLEGYNLREIQKKLGCCINRVWKAGRNFKAAVNELLDLPPHIADLVPKKKTG